MLAEPDSLSLGKVGQVFAVDSGGQIYLADQSRDRVVVYSRDGDPVRTIGRHGRGPGELASIGSPFLVDTLLAVFHSTLKLSVFDARSGRHLAEHVFGGYASSLAAAHGRVWVGTFDRGSARGVVPMLPRELWTPVEGRPDIRLASAMPFPDVYGRYPGLDGANFLSVAATRRGFAVGYGSGTDDIYLVDLASAAVDTATVPIVARQGNTPAGLAMLKAGSRFSFAEQLAATSILYGLFPMREGGLLVWFEDNAAELRGFNDLKNFTGRAYVAVLSPDHQSACVDSEVPFPGSAWPRLAMLGDTLYAIDQVVPDAGSGDPVTVVRRYAIDVADCRWLPTNRPTATGPQ
ncbi:MAG: 6-bladed beta-propeller [Gemmatimonadales bacterium]|nr:6-bladed beta-propeller [Gemmatimonadales bacterium]